MDLVDNPLRHSQNDPKIIISDRLETFSTITISTDAVSINYQHKETVENDQSKLTNIRKDLYPLQHGAHTHEPTSEDDLYRTPLQRKFYYFFEEPRSKWAQLYSIFSVICGVISSIRKNSTSDENHQNIEAGEFESYTETWYRTLPDGTREKSPFQSVIHSFYFSVAAMTTTGYGDVSPITLLGRCIATLTTISGILVAAFISSIIGINSDTEWSKYLQHETKVNFYDMWRTIDETNVNELNSTEQTETVEILQFQNNILVDLIEEIQERFTEIDPPMYKFKYENLRVEYKQTIGKLSQLELEVKEYESLEEIIAEDSNRARIVAIAVASAVREASQQDWEAACRSILENKSLTESEKNCIVALLQDKQFSILFVYATVQYMEFFDILITSL
ncbi:17533_t:CDS:2 [Funneliformis geosporum]|uniref:17533_t:CDS:1 n=1 Tax=Funneliformis geosporum TaxID=1117311 RepID=A0A9W4SCN1_9GLOM|nr:17533_t:CDS:2 [Funneliformis geosporum]